MVAQWNDFGGTLGGSAEWPVISYIAGILITVPAFGLTGVPGACWVALEKSDVIGFSSLGGLIALILVIFAFTNIVTNVPAVIILGHHVAALALQDLNDSDAEIRGWLSVAFIVAMGGSLTVQGSITQVITYSVGQVAPGGSVSFLEHLRVGVPVTVLTVALGLPIILKS